MKGLTSTLGKARRPYAKRLASTLGKEKSPDMKGLTSTLGKGRSLDMRGLVAALGKKNPFPLGARGRDLRAGWPCVSGGRPEGGDEGPASGRRRGYFPKRLLYCEGVRPYISAK